MTPPPHPQGNGKPGDVAESEREKAVVRAAQKWGDTDAADVVEMLAAELELSNALVALGAVTVEPVFHLRSYGDVSAAELGGVQHSGKRSAEVNCKLDMDQGARAAALAEEMTQSDLDKYASELIWLRDAFAAASPPPQSAQLIEPAYVACHQCSNCDHIGINDEHPTDAACNQRSCGWHDPSPTEDVCPGCSENGTMASACPECGCHYEFLADAHIPAGSGLMEGKDAVRDVLAERQRQVTAEGYFPAHDDEHDKGELAVAAACYALRGNDPTLWITAGQRPCFGSRFLQRVESWVKSKNRRSNLVRAAALLLAEIERLDRAALSQGQQTEQGSRNGD